MEIICGATAHKDIHCGGIRISFHLSYIFFYLHIIKYKKLQKYRDPAKKGLYVKKVLDIQGLEVYY
jgi:hypothetical protein